jgi:putative ABC transport system substrate-binding protein
VRRREFIAGLGGAAVVGPVAAWAQERARRVGVLMDLAADNADGQARIAAFQQGLQQLGWSGGGNLQIDYRWSAGNADNFRRHATELVALAPDVVLANGSPAVAALQQATRTVPIVFATVIDPVGAGFVESMARPGGHTTGFTVFEYGISGKWLELLKQIAPGVTRAAVLRDPTIASGSGQLGAIQSVAPSFGVELRPFGVRDAGEIERAVTAFAREPNGGLIVTGSGLANVHRDLIIKLAAQHRLPAVYAYRANVVRAGSAQSVPASSGLRRSHPQGREARRSARASADEIRVGDQPQDRPRARPHRACDVVGARR